jgi:hypothetical protein
VQRAKQLDMGTRQLPVALSIGHRIERVEKLVVALETENRQMRHMIDAVSYWHPLPRCFPKNLIDVLQPSAVMHSWHGQRHWNFNGLWFDSRNSCTTLYLS